MKKRVVLCVTNDLSGDQRVHKVSMSLIKLGYEPVLVGRILPNSQPLDRPYNCRRFHLFFTKGPLFYTAFNIRLFFYLLFVRADIFLANDLDTLSAVFFAGKVRRKRIVYDSHEYFTEVPELVGRPAVKRVWESIEKWVFPKLKSVYTVNGSIAEIYAKKYQLEVGVIRNVPSSLPREMAVGSLPAGFTDRPVIIYQGAVNIGRGLEEMIHAIKLLPDYHFLIIGGGDILLQLEQLVKELNLSTRIYFTGRLPFNQLAWYTQKAVLGMSLEQDLGLNYHYALPNKLFDYMRAGIPVIASDLPEIRRVVDSVKFGLIVNKFDPEHLSQSIDTIVKNQDQLAEWRQNALKAANDYTWEAEEIKLEQYFPKLV